MDALERIGAQARRGAIAAPACRGPACPAFALCQGRCGTKRAALEESEEPMPSAWERSTLWPPAGQASAAMG